MRRRATSSSLLPCTTLVRAGGSTDYTTTVVVNNVAPTGTISNNGPVNEGSSATAQITGVTDPSNADTAAGFRYSFALTSAGLAASYPTAGPPSPANLPCRLI